MNSNIIVLLTIVCSIIFGAFFGILFYKARSRKIDREILKNAQEVINGTRKNSIILDGEEYDASKFRLRDKDGNETLIDLKGGEIVQHDRKQNEEVEDIEVPSSPREDSGCTRKKKRTLREGIRRFF